MAKGPESRLQLRIRHALEAEFPGSYWWKTHGGPFTPAGIPDLVGCVLGLMFALEVKLDSTDASLVQIRQMTRLKAAGAIVGVVRSIDEALALVREGLAQR